MLSNEIHDNASCSTHTVDPCVVSEGEHSEPPSQIRKSENGNHSDFQYTCIC